jgi:hypothetical protein
MATIKSMAAVREGLEDVGVAFFLLDLCFFLDSYHIFYIRFVLLIFSWYIL